MLSSSTTHARRIEANEYPYISTLKLRDFAMTRCSGLLRLPSSMGTIQPYSRIPQRRDLLSTLHTFEQPYKMAIDVLSCFQRCTRYSEKNTAVASSPDSAGSRGFRRFRCCPSICDCSCVSAGSPNAGLVILRLLYSTESLCVRRS